MNFLLPFLLLIPLVSGAETLPYLDFFEPLQDYPEMGNDLPPELLHSQIAEIEFQSRGQPANCPVHSFVENVLFAFEGAGGYSPAFFKLIEKKAENRVLGYRSKLLLGNEKVLRALDKEDKKAPAEPALAKWLLSQKMLRLKEQKFNTLYYAQTQSRDAIACALLIFQQASQEKRTPTIAVTGYSMGGFAAYEFAKILEEKNIPIRFVLTVDPVRKGWGGVGDVIRRRQDKEIHKTSNVWRWINFFQLKDTRSAGVGIRGSNVSGADENLELKDPWEVRFEDGTVQVMETKTYHTFIPSYPEVSKAFDQLF